ncbi:MAG TPA: DNA repair protein RadC [Steroidobacteraceae bacterium]|nr:DNA repair protein RadC [Steroidobacteraceae bacterium]
MATLRTFREDQPAEKLFRCGPGALSEAELLSAIMRRGIKGRSAIQFAHDVLHEFGGLRGLLSAEQQRFLKVFGLTRAKYAQLQAALELARRHYQQQLESGPCLTSPRATRDFLVARLRDRPYEVFCCLYLDNRHRLTAFEELFRGTIDGASVHPREVVREALGHRAAAVILAHNHPSGVAEPSQADELITQRLRDALALVDIRLLDHLIVGDGVCTSLAERGLI